MPAPPRTGIDGIHTVRRPCDETNLCCATSTEHTALSSVAAPGARSDASTRPQPRLVALEHTATSDPDEFAISGTARCSSACGH
jgi:hypothetical protein